MLDGLPFHRKLIAVALLTTLPCIVIALEIVGKLPFWAIGYVSEAAAAVIVAVVGIFAAWPVRIDSHIERIGHQHSILRRELNAAASAGASGRAQKIVDAASTTLRNIPRHRSFQGASASTALEDYRASVEQLRSFARGIAANGKDLQIRGDSKGGLLPLWQGVQDAYRSYVLALTGLDPSLLAAATDSHGGARFSESTIIRRLP